MDGLQAMDIATRLLGTKDWLDSVLERAARPGEEPGSAIDGAIGAIVRIRVPSYYCGLSQYRSALISR